MTTKTKTSGRLNRLEALRGFAAFYVVLYHTLPHHYEICGINVGLLFGFGQEAVILFFLMSGIVIGLSYLCSSDQSFRTYFSKRFLRIFIPLFPIYALGYILECMKHGQLADPQWWNLFLNIFMFQDLESLKPGVVTTPYMHNIPLWSLSYEWWFYMIFFPIIKINQVTIRRFIVILLVATGALTYQISPNFVSRLLMYFAIWWSGVEIGILYLERTHHDWRKYRFPITLMSVSILIQGISVFWQYRSGTANYNGKTSAGMHPFLELRHLVFAALMIAVGLIWMKFRWLGFNYIFGVFAMLAPISYGIYIAHHYTISNATYFSFIGVPALEYLCYWIVTLAVAFFIEVFIYRRVVSRWTRPRAACESDTVATSCLR